MFQALFNSLSGLFSFSRSLDTVSNNVSNMNTPGFRGSDSFFSNISHGNGTAVVGQGTRTSFGGFKSTGERTHLAVDGNGFFVLRDDSGALFYTRAGEFQFIDGILEDKVTGYKVMGMGENGGLVEIDLNDDQYLLPEASSKVNLVGSINPEDDETLVPDILLYDVSGNTHKVSLKITKYTDPVNDIPSPDPSPGRPRGPAPATVEDGEGNRYTVTVVMEDGTEVSPGFEIRFTSGSGIDTPLEGFNTFTANLTFGGVAQAVEFNFGAPGSTSGVFLSGFDGSVTGNVVDGHARLELSNFEFQADGTLKLSYGNGGAETVDGPQLALAAFANEGSLEMLEGRLVADTASGEVTIGRPKDGKFGSIKAGTLELANVDLTQEFAEMIIIQRGYQASSRVMTVGNEMIEQLYNSTRGG